MKLLHPHNLQDEQVQKRAAEVVTVIMYLVQKAQGEAERTGLV